MRFRFRVFIPAPIPRHRLRPPRRPFFTTAAGGAATGSAGGGASRDGNLFLIPGATMATIAMLGILHARRLYEDKKVEEMKEKGIEPEFSPDAKATFFKLLPLRTMSRLWGHMTSLELPVWMRSFMYEGWARAFHSNLEEAALPLENYSSLQEFFTRRLKDGSRPINGDPHCLVSPVDGKVLRFGQLKGSGAMIEQVKGFSYSASSLLGINSSLHEIVRNDTGQENSEPRVSEDSGKRSWWRISFASPKVHNQISACPMKGVFYCVLYLSPGDYHRVHSPVDWHVFLRRHFTGRLYPQNERAVRTIRNLYVVNERVVLEGRWGEGFMALAAVGATNVGSIELLIEPELRTNRPKQRLLQSEPPEERIYEPEGTGTMLKKGEEIAAFKMGSTVVLVFEAPISEPNGKCGLSSEFKFCVRPGDKIKVGEALGKWGGS